MDPLIGVGLKYALGEQCKIYVDSTYVHEAGEPHTGQLDILNTSIGLQLQF